jgi:hypothetical protein
MVIDAPESYCGLVPVQTVAVRMRPGDNDFLFSAGFVTGQHHDPTGSGSPTPVHTCAAGFNSDFSHAWAAACRNFAAEHPSDTSESAAETHGTLAG